MSPEELARKEKLTEEFSSLYYDIYKKFHKNMCHQVTDDTNRVILSAFKISPERLAHDALLRLAEDEFRV